MNDISQYISLESINEENIKVGNSYFRDDVWDFTGLIKGKEHQSSSQQQLRFSDISREKMKFTIKQYCLTLLLTHSFSSVLRARIAFTQLFKFLDEQYPHIDSFSKINKVIANSYLNWLFSTKGISTNQPLSAVSIKRCSTSLRDLLIEGNRKNWDVPNECSWIDALHENIVLKAPLIKKDNSRITTKVPYTKETIEKVIMSALQEKNIIIKACIILQTQLGMRVNEALTIKEGCIRYYDGKPFIFYTTTKTEVGVIEVQKPANELVVTVIRELDEHTKQLREETNLPYLFLHKVQYGSKVCVVASNCFTKNYLNKFVERWDIRENGELIKLTSHYFRHFFAQLAWQGGMSSPAIMQMMNHKSLVMTETYTYNLQQQIQDKFAEIMSDPDSLVGSGVGNIKERLKQNNPFKGKTEREIKIIMDAMQIRVLANGICMHHPLRKEKCAISEGKDCIYCDKYVSNKMCIGSHKQRIKRLEDEMKRAKEQGQSIWYSKVEIERNYIKDTFILPFEKMQDGVSVNE